MNAVVLGFAVILAAVFAAASFAGSRVDPDTGDEPADGEIAEAGGHGGEGEGASGMEQAAEAATLPGLAVSDGGYTLQPARTALARRDELRFRIARPDGRPVREFEVEHARRMHLILVRRDLTGFQHLHPRMAEDGSWSTRVRLSEPGSYRMFADFSVGGVKRTLGADLTVEGPVETRPLPAPATSDQTDGYHVRLASPTLRAGRETELRFEVTRGGRPVAVQPHLDARGHLVALREGDLAYLHVHPDESELAFGAEFPTAGRYRLFLQFKVAGVVRTVAYTAEVGR